MAAPCRQRHNPWLAVLATLLIGCAMATRVGAGPLAHSTSPYLLQHADDAIDWQPWSEAALARARRENKPIFLSIGYAACHWCHVMARTTFADRQVIELLNRHVVSVLVDREERPDLDSHFMKILSGMTGRSGWPANFFLTPDIVPLFAAGYLAPEAQYGRPGFLSVLQTLVREWNNDRQAILRDAEITRDQLRALAETVPSGGAVSSEDPRDNARRAWAKSFDAKYGGFAGEPKFLFPNVLSFLLHNGVRRNDSALLQQVFLTLDQMAAGGVRDQLGGAFHRYAVDRFWQVPHFEILLADNALLARLYLEAYQASGQARYAVVARGILEDLINRFRLTSGGFASALDADSEEEEGLYYTWTAAEVRSVLGVEKAKPFIAAYVDQSYGLVRGRSVLRLREGPDSFTRTHEPLAASRSQLLRARALRTAPFRDEKVLTSWNALAVSALAKAAQVWDDGRYLQLAQEGMDYLLAPLLSTGELSHSRLGRRATQEVFLDDYAFLVQALVDLYETDFQVRHLESARSLTKSLIERFQEAPGRPFRFSPIDRPSGIPARTILDEDGAPSGNAAALIALHRLVSFGAERDFAAQAETITQALGRYLELSAPAATGLLAALDYRPVESHEIVVVGSPGSADTRRLLQEVYKRLLPGTVFALIAPNASPQNERWPLLAGRPLLANAATAYVCKNRLCKLPVDQPAALAIQLDELMMPSRR
ncbi:MAG TPA: thioredoxin domain-containing protein [Alphaproteobacteria bacterium]|jgi:hypothetical protein|nr:thioredoxin domain-containing protein [Alphaproteobacteria bacterium]